MQTRLHRIFFSLLLAVAPVCLHHGASANAADPVPPADAVPPLVLVAPPESLSPEVEHAATHAMEAAPEDAADEPPPAPGATSGETEHRRVNYIEGGKEAEPNAWPFAASLIYQDGGVFIHYCGGSLIADRWVLTAAHCKPAKGHIVIIGRHDLLQPGGIATRVEKVVRHPDYDPLSGANDIALVRLGAHGGRNLTRVTFDSPPAAGQSVTGIGWGAVGAGEEASAVLRQVEVPVWETARCEESYAGTSRSITPDVICAADQGKNACDGDSGGPLLDTSSGEAVQVGIVSYGVGCANDAFPGVYTRVDRYIAWIREWV